MKNIQEIRDILCEEIDKLRNKTTTPSNVNAIVNAVGKVLTTVKMEMEHAKLTNSQPNMKFMALPAPEKPCADPQDAAE